MLWAWIFGWIGIRVPKELVPVISFTLFAAMLVVGTNLAFRPTTSSINSQNGIRLKKRLVIFGTGACLYLIAIVAVIVIFFGVLFPIPFPIPEPGQSREEDIQAMEQWLYRSRITSVIVLLTGIGFPIAYLLFFIKDRAWVLIASPLFLVMSSCLLLGPLVYGGEISETDYSTPVGILSMLGLLQILWMAVILFSPLQQLTRRLGFAVLGVLLLIALSEISKLNLHQYLQPPKVSDNLVR